MQKNDEKLAENAESQTGKTSQADASSEWKDYGKFLLKLALFMMILRSFIISPFNIPSESMQPRLLIGDYLLVAKWPYGYSKHSIVFGLPIIPGRMFASEPERGDVVVFKAPPTQKQDYIKRVIGLPGDQVQMREGILYLNGNAIKKERIADFVVPVTQNMIDAALQKERENGVKVHPCHRKALEELNEKGERQCRYRRYRETLPEGKTYEILDVDDDSEADTTTFFYVPEGQLFVMGDNRDRSLDSRYPAIENQGVGFVPQENLVGRAMVSVFSTDGSSSWLLPWTWFTAARWDRVGETF